MLPYPNINPILFEIGPFALRWYSLAYIVGILGGFHLFKSIFKQRFSVGTEDLLNLMSYTMIGILLGGRLGYVLFYNLAHYLSNPLDILALWQGGMSYHGGALGAAIVFYWFAVSRKQNPWAYLDLLGLGSTLGIFLGRVANFINGELYGRVTDSAFGMIFPEGGPLARHPSQLYEAFLEGLLSGVILLLLFKKARLKDGQLFAVYMMLYGIFRFIVEFFREPDAHLGTVIGSLSMGQLLCFIMLVAGMILFLRQGKMTYENRT